MTIDIGRTAFRGFKLIGERPWLVVIWGLIYIVALIVLIVVAGGLLIGLGLGLTAARDANGLPTSSLTSMLILIPFVLAAFLAVTAVFMCGTYRAVLKPQERGLAYLKLGAAEFRMMGLLLLAGVMWAGIYVGVAILNIVLGGITLGLGLVLTIPLGAAIFAFLSVKMSLAGVINFMEGSLGIGESWSLTRNNFWNLFLVYLLLAVIWFVVFLISAAVQSGLQGAVGMPNIFSGLDPSRAAAAPTFNAASVAVALVGFLINVVVTAVNMMILYAPHAEAYLQLKPRPADQTSDVFA